MQCLIDYNKWCAFHVRFLKEVYLQVEGWLVVILVTRQIEVCAFDAQSDRPGLSDGCRVRVGRHVQVHCGESDGYRVILINHGPENVSRKLLEAQLNQFNKFKLPILST